MKSHRNHLIINTPSLLLSLTALALYYCSIFDFQAQIWNLARKSWKTKNFIIAVVEAKKFSAESKIKDFILYISLYTLQNNSSLIFFTNNFLLGWSFSCRVVMRQNLSWEFLLWENANNFNVCSCSFCGLFCCWDSLWNLSLK